MFTVTVPNQCGCFIKSEFKGEKSFDNQKDAYTYAKILEELMNEEFCGKHHYFAQKVDEYNFILQGAINPNASAGCSSGSCGTGSCGSTSCSPDMMDNSPVSNGCGSGCGCH